MTLTVGLMLTRSALPPTPEIRAIRRDFGVVPHPDITPLVRTAGALRDFVLIHIRPPGNVVIFSALNFDHLASLRRLICAATASAPPKSRRGWFEAGLQRAGGVVALKSTSPKQEAEMTAAIIPRP